MRQQISRCIRRFDNEHARARVRSPEYAAQTAAVGGTGTERPPALQVNMQMPVLHCLPHLSVFACARCCFCSQLYRDKHPDGVPRLLVEESLQHIPFVAKELQDRFAFRFELSCTPKSVCLSNRLQLQVQVYPAMHAHCSFSLCRPCTLSCSKLHAEAHEAGQAQLGDTNDTQEAHEELLLARCVISFCIHKKMAATYLCCVPPTPFVSAVLVLSVSPVLSV